MQHNRWRRCKNGVCRVSANGLPVVLVSFKDLTNSSRRRSSSVRVSSLGVFSSSMFSELEL